MMNKKSSKVGFIVFICIALLSGWFGVLVDSLLTEQPEGETLGMLIWLVTPFVAVLVLRAKNKEWRDSGLAFNFKHNIRWYLTSIFIYPLVMAITIGLAILFKAVTFESTSLATLLSLVGTAIAINIVKNIFEEFVWRGYLAQKLIQFKFNDWMIYIISGLVWALWHLPYYLFFLDDSFFEHSSRVEMVITSCILLTAWSIVYVELYRLTKSVWPAVIMHAIEDGIPTTLLVMTATITLNSNAVFWLDPLTGVIATLIFISIGLILRRIRKKKLGEV